MRCEEKITYVEGKKRRHRVEVFALGPGRTILAALRDNKPPYELPGGGVDKLETNDKSGARELAEEAGWTGFNFLHLKLDSDFIFEGKDDPWFTGGGWEQEENIAVVCIVDKFKPDLKFGSEGDSLDFKLVSIEDIIRESEEGLQKQLSARNRMRCLFRLAVFKKLASYRPDKLNEW